MSDWRERTNRRRDERQIKLPQIRPPGGSKKNTKKWCRGKIGVTHTLICVDYNDHKHAGRRFGAGWKILICSECKKEMDHWLPSPFKRGQQTPPDWVI